MTLRYLMWLMLVSGAVIWYVEQSKNEFLWPKLETELPLSEKLDIGIGEYLIAGGVGLLIYTR